ncbi:MAG: sigma-E factor negative regulatory protein [Rhodocyclales bacterium]|nr:sigma-E factor negative regulatory protein [Rhodocyclales bacterium]
MKSEISALLDDELTPEAAERTLEALNQDWDLRDAWETYHLIGDALRRSPDLSPDFSGRVMALLAEGPTVLAPAAQRTPKASPLRFLLPLAASLMGMGAVAWVAMSLQGPQPVPVAAAPASPRPVAAAAMAPMPPPAAGAVKETLKEYLVAHQAYSASAGIQGVAPYVRSVAEIRQGGKQ